MLNRLWRMIDSIKIKHKLLLIFLVGAVLPVAFLIVLFSTRIVSNLYEREDTMIRADLNMVATRLESAILSADTLATKYATDNNLIFALETYSLNSPQPIETIRQIDKTVSTDVLVNSNISQVDLYYTNPDLFDTAYLHRITEDFIAANPWYQAFKQSGKSTYVTSEICKNGNHQILLLKQLNLLNYNTQNFVKITISQDVLNEICTSVISDTQEFNIMLINPEGNVVFATDRFSVPYSFSGDSLGSSDYLHVELENNTPFSGWRVAATAPGSSITDSFVSYFLMLFMVVIAVFSFATAMIYILAHSIIWRLEHMVQVMQSSSGGMLSYIDLPMGGDEIGQTAEQYNNMVSSSRQLMEQLISSRRDIEELLEDKTEANRQLYEANEKLAAANEELTTSLQEIQIRDVKIKELVYIDSLTSLDNRYSISQKITSIIAQAKDDERFAVIFIDIDDFKYINDTYGHETGDKVIQQTAQRLRMFGGGEQFLIGRFGGDEFMVIVRNFDNQKRLMDLCDGIRTALKNTMYIDNVAFGIAISMGVSLFPAHGVTKDELIKSTEIALYRAKGQGKDCIVFYDSSMNRLLSEKIDLQNSIKEANKNHCFLLFYQPYYDARSQKIAGCEALIRWEKRCNLNISPYELIRNAEEMGLILEMGEWIFTEACLFIKRMNRILDKPIRVAVNLSAAQLMHVSFFERYLAIVRRYDIDPSHVCLEMTETILMHSIERGSSIIGRLKDIGFSISLDDFGTGYSSLKYFKDLPVNILKIDRGFIQHIAENDYDAQLVETMIRLAHNKNMKVIAEGVETREQLDKLIELNCDMIQGYYFSRPLPEQDAVKLIRSSLEVLNESI